MAEENQELEGSAFEFEYVTSSVGIRAGDGIGVHVVNDSGVAESTRVVIYKNTGAGAVTVADTGRVTVTQTWTWAMGFTVMDDADYWLRVQTTSDSLIPRASFPTVTYRPGDFAVFSLTRKRLW